MKCLSCKNITEVTFNIFKENGETQSIVKDDIIEIVGSNAVEHLQPEDEVCVTCIKMLDIIAKVKRQLTQVILRQKELQSPINYGRFWNFLVRSSQPSKLQGRPYVSPFAPSLTPTSNFTEYDLDFNTKKRPPSSRSIASNVGNEEVEYYFAKRNRGRPRSAPANEKKRVRLRSVQSENDRYSRLGKSPKRCYDLPELKFDEFGQLKNVETRSLSRSLEFYCSDCSSFSTNLNKYTNHMIQEHSYKAFYRCSICDTYYLKKLHLKMHQRIHENYYLKCPICGNGYNNISMFKAHTEQHILYSIACAYCDLAFLTKKEYQTHVADAHEGKKRKIETRKEHKILDRAVYVRDRSDRTLIQSKDYKMFYKDLLSRGGSPFKEEDTLDLRLNRTPCKPFKAYITGLGDDLYSIRTRNESNQGGDSTESSDSSGDRHDDDTSTSVPTSDSSESEVDLDGGRAPSKAKRPPPKRRLKETNRPVNGTDSPPVTAEHNSFQELFTDEELKNMNFDDCNIFNERREARTRPTDGAPDEKRPLSERGDGGSSNSQKGGDAEKPPIHRISPDSNKSESQSSTI